MTWHPLVVAATLAGSLLFAVPAQAHTHLTASSPLEGAIVRNVRSMRLRFSEKIVPAFSRAQLVMTGMPGVKNHRPRRIPVETAVLKDGRTLLIASPALLRPGSYRLNWRTVSKDTHPIEGQIRFAVR